MRKTPQRRKIVIALALASGTLLAPMAAQADQFINVLTGGTSGVYYPLGVALAKIYADKIPGVRTQVQSTKASVENLNLLQAGKGEIALALGDSVKSAWEGDEEVGFPKKLDKLRGIAAVYPNVIQIVASQGSGVKTFADLKGKSLSVGAPKSGTEVNARRIFEAMGMSYKDLGKTEYLPFGESVELIKNRQLDATLQSAGLGVSSIRDLASSLPITMVVGAGRRGQEARPAVRRDDDPGQHLYRPDRRRADAGRRQLPRHAFGRVRRDGLPDDQAAVREPRQHGRRAQGGHGDLAQDRDRGHAGAAAPGCDALLQGKGPDEVSRTRCEHPDGRRGPRSPAATTPCSSSTSPWPAAFPSGGQGRLLFWIALAFSTFQIVTAAHILDLPSQIVRAVHVGFLLALVFPLMAAARMDGAAVACPGLGRQPRWPRLIAVYQWVEYNALILRAGDPTTLDIVVGVALLALLFVATWRAMGPALPIISGTFLAYCLFGQYLPAPLNHRGYDFAQVIDHMAFGTEGVYGIPTYVSSSYIFLFILFGAFLEKAGMIGLFTDIAMGLFGSRRGGPAKVAVVSSGLMGTISGSGVANVVTTGQFTIPLMKRFGYRAAFAGGVEATASMGGQIMPPVMGAVAFIMAETLDVPYATVVKAAVVPAMLYFLSAFWMVHLEAGRAGLAGLSKDELPSPMRALRDKWFLILPLVGAGAACCSPATRRCSPAPSAWR